MVITSGTNLRKLATVSKCYGETSCSIWDSGREDTISSTIRSSIMSKSNLSKLNQILLSSSPFQFSSLFPELSFCFPLGWLFSPTLFLRNSYLRKPGTNSSNKWARRETKQLRSFFISYQSISIIWRRTSLLIRKTKKRLDNSNIYCDLIMFSQQIYFSLEDSTKTSLTLNSSIPKPCFTLLTLWASVPSQVWTQSTIFWRYLRSRYQLMPPSSKFSQGID